MKKNAALVKTPHAQKSTHTIGDSVIKKLLRDGHRAIELCNALINTSYPNDTTVEICDLESTLAARYNDVALLIDNQLLLAIEHQSTISPNLPLRLLEYISGIYALHFVKHDALYKNKQYKIPTPKIFVLYNGKEKLINTQLKLSSAFMYTDPNPNLEIIVDVIDVNYNSGHELLTKSPSINGYAYLMKLFHHYQSEGYTRDKATGLAIEQCIEEGVLKDFLTTHYEEVNSMLNLEYNQEAEYRALYEDGFEEGKGQNLIEMAKKMILRGYPVKNISEDTGFSIDEINQMSCD